MNKIDTQALNMIVGTNAWNQQQIVLVYEALVQQHKQQYCATADVSRCAKQASMLLKQTQHTKGYVQDQSEPK